MAGTGQSQKRGVLVCISGDLLDEKVKLRRDNTIIGREKNDIVVIDPEVSATHCQIQYMNNEYVIFDMNSSNGTYVNNDRIVKKKLNEGDVIQLGKTSFKFVLEDEKSVRHMPTIFRPSNNERSNSLVDTLIEHELKQPTKVQMELYVTYGDGSKEKIELRQDEVFIGRAASFGKFDQDSEISRKHSLIKKNDTGEIFIEDQGSTNGTFLNDEKIKGMHLVKAKDIIKIGKCKIKVKIIS